MQSVSRFGRIAALGAVIGAIVLVGIIFFGGGDGGYTVNARFINASQLVKGNLAQIGGTQAGSVKDIRITDDGQAEIKLEIDEDYAPLRRGTTAVIRQASLSGIANRYVDLRLPGAGGKGEVPAGGGKGEIPDGGRVTVDETTSPVELDQLFNTLDPKTRRAVQEFFKGGAKQYAGKGKEANRGFQYLNPALSTSSRIFRELNKDQPVLERFLVDSAKLVTTVASRNDDLAALVGNANQTTRAIGNEKVALADALNRLPGFMRTANTTFVNLRAALDDVDPLVNASKPVVKRPGAGNDLQELLPELRRFAADAEPAVADLNRIVRHPGANNDLIDLQETFPPLAQIALDRGRRSVNPAAVPLRGNQIPGPGRPRDVGVVRGAFPELAEALRRGAPFIAYGRPFTKELFGWFDDFSHTGLYDALGGLSRTQTYFNEFSFQDNIAGPAGADGTPQYGEYKRCPGASEPQAPDGSNVWNSGEQQELDCKEADRATGDIDTSNPEGENRSP